jgi:hypothetical protein
VWLRPTPAQLQESFSLEYKSHLFEASCYIPLRKFNLGESGDVRELGASFFNKNYRATWAKLSLKQSHLMYDIRRA